MPTPINIGRPRILPNKTTELQEGISAQEAKAKLVEIAGNLIKQDGSIKSGYLRLHETGDSQHMLSRGGGHFRTGYSAAGSMIRQLVDTAYGPDSPAAKSLNRYLTGSSKITTRSLVKLVATLEGDQSALSAKLKGKPLVKGRLDINREIQAARQRQEILNGKIYLTAMSRKDPIVESAFKERNWYHVAFPALGFAEPRSAIDTLNHDLDNINFLRSELIKRMEDYAELRLKGGLDPEADVAASQAQPPAGIDQGEDQAAVQPEGLPPGPVGRSLLRLLNDVESQRQQAIEGLLEQLEKSVKPEVDGNEREPALSKDNVKGKLEANEAYRQLLQFAKETLEQDLAQPEPQGFAGLNSTIYSRQQELDAKGRTPGLRRDWNLSAIDKLGKALDEHREQMLKLAGDAGNAAQASAGKNR